ncbi:arylsulfatase B [Caerostris extrusa]|uniref:Arylsulfatase B n=1 Tax=Caerostris extrusa TaxID=172846 RepID=A0AAV4X0C3_CAEEX|nr:arylsulfatase B [Caerostris extrusa]
MIWAGMTSATMDLPDPPPPNIDALALNGLTLQNYYGEWLCTPSRAALLTGRYPIRYGLQHSVFLGGEASGLPLNEVILPQYLKQLGYKTHMVGKWHLGYQTKEYTPTYRGFDSFLGYWNGFIDYYDHTYYERLIEIPNRKSFLGVDFHNGTSPVTDAQGRYATHVFTEAAENIIRDHDLSKPLFLYLAQIAPHSGNSYQFMQAPSEDISKFKYINDINRRIHAAVVSGLDQSVGAVFRALYKRDMLENTVFLFVSDNGGDIDLSRGGYGSNYPLRGVKYTQWEGGIRVPAVIWSPLLKLDKPRVSHQLMHVTDWLPTLYSGVLGRKLSDLGPIDGFDMWDSLLDGCSSPRNQALQNLDTVDGTSAFRLGDFKIVNGSRNAGYQTWFGPSGLENFDGPTNYKWVFKDGSIVGEILMEMGMWIANNPKDVYKKLRITCEQPPPETAYNCDPNKKPCLFNISADPCEYVNLADDHPEVVEQMMGIVLKYKAEAVKSQSKSPDRKADPMCHQHQYVTWLDPEHHNECDYSSEENIRINIY